MAFDWRDPVRRELAECLKVPLRNGTELPAAQVYAGAEWTGNDFLERAYGSRSDRGFLQSPPADKEERERWERLYRWIGVGWCPKVLPIVCFVDNRETFEGPMWKDSVFPVDRDAEDWHEYCKRFDHFTNQSRKARLRQNWTLDGGSKVLMQDGAFSAVSENWAYYSKYRQAIFYRSRNLRKDCDNLRRTGTSHLIWLFQTGRWIPVKATPDKQKSEDVFARPEIVRELGGWGHELDSNADEKFLDTIGVRSGWRELDDADWHRWLELSTVVSKNKLDRDLKLKHAVCSLYEAALRHWTGNDEYPRKPPRTWSGPGWWVKRLADNTETWRLAQGRDDVYFIDRPDLDELRLPGLWVFPVRLNRLEKAAKERFGLKMLSEHLLGEPDAAASVDSPTQAVRQKVADRLSAVNAYLQMVDRESLGCLEPSSLPDVSVVEELKVQFRLHDRVVGDGLKLDAYHSRSDGCWTLWLDSALFDETGRPATSVWEYVASALVYSGDLSLDAQPCLKDLLLYEGADLTRKLLNLGVTKETVDRIVPGEPMPHVDVGPRAGTEEPKAPDQESEKEGTGAIIGPPPTRTPGGSGGRGSGASGGTGGPRPTSAIQPGGEAQEWMRDELRKRLGSEGWRVSDAPTHDEELRETDIELNHDQFGSFHVEVKHCERHAIYWPENEVEKAKENTDRYFVVILTRDREKHFEEYWIVDPLKDLKDLPRTGVWEWRGRQDGVELSGAAATWSVPAPKPERSAAGFSFKLEIKGTWLKTHHAEFEAVKTRMNSQDFLPS